MYIYIPADRPPASRLLPLSRNRRVKRRGRCGRGSARSDSAARVASGPATVAVKKRVEYIYVKRYGWMDRWIER